MIEVMGYELDGAAMGWIITGIIVVIYALNRYKPFLKDKIIAEATKISVALDGLTVMDSDHAALYKEYGEAVDAFIAALKQGDSAAIKKLGKEAIEAGKATLAYVPKKA
jgi:hypothetical protein